MNRSQDSRIVLTLDGGGTNFVFSAMGGGEEQFDPLILPSHGTDLDKCLATIQEGFQRTIDGLTLAPSAISFAFPGPADYPRGIIGDLANLPAFQGGVPLGPMLEDRFSLPTFINNDGDLFAYGEATHGLLPEVNRDLEAVGSPRRFRNLWGSTLGTGFGGGFVRDGRLHLGDNSSGAEIWCTRSKKNPEFIAEEGVSIRSVRRIYARLAGIPPEKAPEPRVIFRIGMGEIPGKIEAARKAFQYLGEEAGNALATASTLVDGLVVLGGGLSGAAPLFLPSLVAEMNGTLGTLSGGRCSRMDFRAFNLEDPAEYKVFLKGETRTLKVPGSGQEITYDPLKRIGVGISRLGTSRAVAIGAYAFALAELDHLPSTSGSLAELICSSEASRLGDATS